MKKIIRINLGPVEGIPMGQGHCFRIEGEDIAVFRGRDGAISAIENTCPHMKGPLAEGIIGDGKVVCPLHGHRFDLKTGEGSESLECVRTFETSVENGNVFIAYAPASKENVHC